MIADLVRQREQSGAVALQKDFSEGNLRYTCNASTSSSGAPAILIEGRIVGIGTALFHVLPGPPLGGAPHSVFVKWVGLTPLGVVVLGQPAAERLNEMCTFIARARAEKPFISNPDLVERFARGRSQRARRSRRCRYDWPLNDGANPKLWYSFDTIGYADFPTYKELRL
jgi:hypothetical protein